MADPGYAPEHVARTAVRQLGPEAADWVARMRARYPDASADSLARLAAAYFIRAARREGASNGLTGPLGLLTPLALVLRGQARVVLHIAAVYGADPTSEERARDLVRLLRVPRLTEPIPRALTDAGRLIGAHALVRIAARVMPFGAAIAGAIHSGRSTGDLAIRAMQYYRRRAHTQR